jgi:hypothetical protein
MLVKVNYQIGQYSGSEYVNADENDDNDIIIAKVKKRLKKDIMMPMYYAHFEIER